MNTCQPLIGNKSAPRSAVALAKTSEPLSRKTLTILTLQQKPYKRNTLHAGEERRGKERKDEKLEERKNAA